MPTLKKRLLITFLVLLAMAELLDLTGKWQIILKNIFDNIITIIKIYFLINILLGVFYFRENKNKKEGGVLLVETIYDSTAVISTFYAGTIYFSGLFSIGELFSEKNLPSIAANAFLIYWSLKLFIYRINKTFY